MRAGDPWCTLCYADLRPPPTPAPPPPPVSVEGVPSQPPVPGPQAGGGREEPTWPCAACGTANRLERDTCSGCGAPFLSGLRDAEAPLLELPLVGDLTRLERSHRLALAAGVVLAFVALTLLLGLVFR